MRTLAGPGTSREASAAAGARAAAPRHCSRTARFALALAAGKGSGAAGRLLNIGGGTSLPGAIARRIDPLVLQKVAAASKARKAVITGSNGKTTTCRMLAALAQAPAPASPRTGPGRTCSRA